MKKYEALLFDMNGTMIDDMQYHIIAWHRIVNSFGANMSMEEVKEQCYGKNSELLDRVFPGRFSDAEKDAMSLEKERAYQAAFLPELKLIDGLDSFLVNARKNRLRMAIGTAAIMFNVDFVLDGLSLRDYFETIVSADDVKLSKPDPETWILCAEKLGVSPEKCVVFEDSPKGAEAALRAGMDCVAITTMHTESEFSHLSNIIAVIDNFNGITPESLF